MILALYENPNRVKLYSSEYPEELLAARYLRVTDLKRDLIKPEESHWEQRLGPLEQLMLLSFERAPITGLSEGIMKWATIALGGRNAFADLILRARICPSGTGISSDSLDNLYADRIAISTDCWNAYRYLKRYLTAQGWEEKSGPYDEALARDKKTEPKNLGVHTWIYDNLFKLKSK